MSVVIEKMTLDYLSSFYEALLEVAAEEKYLATVKPPKKEAIEKFVSECVDQNHAQYIALSAGQLIGWADIYPSRRDFMAHGGNLGMGVLKAFRGQGIGKALLQKTLEHAWKQGLKRIELEVFSDNEAAIALYQKLGFESEGVKKYARYRGGEYQHILMMAQYRIETSEN